MTQTVVQPLSREQEFIADGRTVVSVEAEAVQALTPRIDREFARACTLILGCEGRVVVIVHTPRDENTRIISMRKANAREQKIYQKRLGTA